MFSDGTQGAFPITHRARSCPTRSGKSGSLGPTLQLVSSGLYPTVPTAFVNAIASGV